MTCIPHIQELLRGFLSLCFLKYALFEACEFQKILHSRSSKDHQPEKESRIMISCQRAILSYMLSHFSLHEVFLQHSTRKHQERSYVWRWSTAFQHRNPNSRHENSKPSTSGYDCSQHAIKQRYHNNLFKLAWIYWSNKIFTFFFPCSIQRESWKLLSKIIWDVYICIEERRVLVVYKVWAYCEQRNKRCTTGIRCKQSKCLKKVP